MLYKLNQENNVFKTLEPLPYKDFSDFEKHEKELENLLAANLLEQLYEDNRLMTIFQERDLQSEADIYALDQSGALHIFELKRSTADKGVTVSPKTEPNSMRFLTHSGIGRSMSDEEEAVFG